MFKVIIMLSVFLSSCGQDICYENWYANVTNYKINTDTTTPNGVRIDTGGFTVDLEGIDNTFDKVENCLNDLIAKKYMPGPEAACLDKYLRPTPIKLSCIKIKIVEPLFSECSEWHFLKEEAPRELCDMKGLDTYCPCRWRWATQDNCNIVTPPGHLGYPYLYDIVKIHTGCNGFWFDPELAKCANLTTEHT